MDQYSECLCSPQFHVKVLGPSPIILGPSVQTQAQIQAQVQAQIQVQAKVQAQVHAKVQAQVQAFY